MEKEESEEEDESDVGLLSIMLLSFWREEYNQKGNS